MQHIASIVTIIVLIANAVLPFGAVSSARSSQAVPAAEKVETTPEPASEAAATETIVPSEQIPTPEPVPSEEAAPVVETPVEEAETYEELKDKGNFLTLTTDAEYVLPGQNVTIRWEFTPNEITVKDNPKMALELSFPKDLVPQGIPAEQFLKDKDNTIRLDDFKPAGELTFTVNEKAKGRLKFSAGVMGEKEKLVEAGLMVYAAEVYDMNQKGGEVDALESKLKIRFPEGVMPEDASIRVNLITKQGQFSRSLGFEPFEVVATSKEKKEEIHKFEKPFTIELAYDPEQINGGEQTLNLFYYDVELATWVPIPSTVDVEKKVVIGTLDHLTSISLGKQDWETATPPTMKGFQVSGFSGAASYSYPIWVPPGPNGLQPNLSLSYSSQVIDSSNSRAQGSWVGMGWSFGAGYIQRNMHATPDFWTKVVGSDYIDNDTGTDGDDTFSLTLNGASYELIRIQDQDSNPETIDYRTADESFLRVRRFHSHGTVAGYANGDTSYWLVWDKQGNKYEFQDRAYYPSKIQGPSNCTVTPAIWRWSMTKVIDPKMGDSRALTYGYNHQQQYNTQGCLSGFNMDMAVYLRSITYPNNQYVIMFDRLVGKREDYDPAWTDPVSRVLYMKDMLTDIWIWGNINNTSDDKESALRHYVFGYSNTVIYPDFKWHTDGTGTTTALVSITEYGANNSGSMPPVQFYYDDKMHLTKATNGYGGEVQFTYQPARDEANAQGSPASRLRGNREGVRVSGEIFLDEYNGNPLGDLGVLKTTFQPGGYYKITIEVGAKYGNYQFKLDGGNAQVGGPVGTFENGVGTYSAILRLPVNARQARPKINCPVYCDIGAITVEPLVTINRVTARAEVDHVLNTTATTTYSYDGFKVNSPAISASAATARPYSEPYGEARGHSQVTVTYPDQTKTITQYYQDDDLKGQSWKVETFDANNNLISRNESGYSIDSLYTTQIVVPVERYSDGTPINPFTGIEINWTRPVTQTVYTYDPGNGKWIGNRTITQYDGTIIGTVAKQYGEVTRVTEWFTDSSYVNTTGWLAFKRTLNGYYGTDTSTQYLVGLKNYTNVYTCNYSTAGCTEGNATLLSSSWNLYDGSTAYNGAPTTGFLTGQRQFLRWNNSDPRYKDTRMYYDEWGNVTSIVAYKGEGSFSSFGQGESITTSFSYNDRFHTYLLSETNPLHPATTWTYNLYFGKPDSELGPNGEATKIRVQYDTFGRVTRVCMPGDTMSLCDFGAFSYTPSYLLFFYDDSQPYTVVKQQWLDSSTYAGTIKFYSGTGNLIQTHITSDPVGSNPSMIVTDYGYDLMGRQTRQTAPYTVAYPGGSTTLVDLYTPSFAPPETVTVYDAQGRVDYVQDPTTKTVSYNYSINTVNANGLGGLYSITETIDANNHSQFTYTDVKGRAVLVVPEAGPRIRYVYDEMNQMTAVRQYAQGDTSDLPFAITSLTYDKAGRKLSMTDPDMGTWTYQYDVFGNMTRQQDAKANTTCLYYDNLMRMTGKAMYTSNTACPGALDANALFRSTYTYDQSSVAIWGGTQPISNGIGQRTSMESRQNTSNNAEKTVFAWNYDTRGRMVFEMLDLGGVGSGSYAVAYGYNGANLPTSITYPGGEMVTTTYNNRMLPVAMSSNRGGGTSLVSGVVYDDKSRLVKMQQGNGLYTVYTYNADNISSGRLYQIAIGTDPNNGGNLFKAQYAYQYNGNISSITDLSAAVGSQISTFTYDGADRLTYGGAATSTNNLVAAYNESVSYTVTGTVDVRNNNAYQYDTNHPRAATNVGTGNSYGYDANGNMTTRIEGGITYTQSWTPDNRLEKVTWINGGITREIRYLYDGDGNKLVEFKALPSDTSRKVYIRNIEEWSFNGAGTSGISKYFFFGGKRVSMRINEDGPIYHFGSDHLGSVSLAVSGGVVQAQSRFTPFGVERWKSGDVTQYGFTGQREVSFGLIDFNARYYSSVLGRFISPDTIIPVASQGNGAFDRYAYVNNNPIKYSDPSGHAVACMNDGNSGCDGTGLGGLTPAQILASNASEDAKQKATYNYWVTHQNYSPLDDPELGEDLDSFVLSNYIFQGQADAAHRVPSWSDRFFNMWEQFLLSGPVVLAGVLNAGDGDDEPFNWKDITESSKAMRQFDKLSPQAQEGYENVLTQLASGDLRGLNAHPLKGERAGQWAADIPGMGKGRGGGRVIYQDACDGIINVIEIIIGHKY
ncbi:MAG TPA: RHS repeat-associated core domain-containing protein [Anaerolineaceae bacterium]|nr:RHS repeat-associated core domain-containing protein [Anaerolineaceae bacterium]